MFIYVYMCVYEFFSSDKNRCKIVLVLDIFILFSQNNKNTFRLKLQATSMHNHSIYTQELMKRMCLFPCSTARKRIFYSDHCLSSHLHGLLYGCENKVFFPVHSGMRAKKE